jgi:hypothetical protein
LAFIDILAFLGIISIILGWCFLLNKHILLSSINKKIPFLDNYIEVVWMLSINKKIIKTLASIFTALSLTVISISVYSQDSTIYVKTNTNPFASPFYLFSNTPDGESINVTLEKGSTYTFIRTDTAHPFNIGDGWRQENTQIESSSTGTGGVVGNTASIDVDEELTISIPLDFNGSQLTYFCYPHSTMKSTFAVVEPSDNSADQPSSWDFDGNG